MMDDLWVLAWSQRQNALHIEPLQRHTSLNREAYADNRPGDYRMLLVGAKADVDATAASIRPTLIARGGTFPAANDARAA